MVEKQVKIAFYFKLQYNKYTNSTKSETVKRVINVWNDLPSTLSIFITGFLQTLIIQD